MCASVHVCMLSETFFFFFFHCLLLWVYVWMLWHGLRGLTVMATLQGERKKMMRQWGGKLADQHMSSGS